MRAEKIRSMGDYELAKLRKKGMDVAYADEVSLKLSHGKVINLIVPFHPEDPDNNDGGFTVRNMVIARFQEALSVLVQESPKLAEKLGLESHLKPVLVGAVKKSRSSAKASVSGEARDACRAVIGSLVKNPAFLEAWPNN